MLGISKKKAISTKTAEKFHQGTDVRGQIEKDPYPIIAVALVALAAIGMRIAFSYNISTSNDFALSGGISSSEHLHKITELVTGKSAFGIDESLNYPFGSSATHPTLFDLAMVPFVIIGKIIGFNVTMSVPIVLAWSGAFFGVLCTITAYFLGKEILESAKAGFLTSLFIAFCPISIAQSTFSNGTGISFLAFLSTVLVYFMFKGIKAYDNSSEYPNFLSILKSKKSLKFAIYSGFILSIITLSWDKFRPIFITTIFCMIILVLTSRFTGKDSRSPAIFFSVILFTAIIVSALYYTKVNLWTPTSHGIFALSIFSSIICLTFSFLQRKSCLFTIPMFSTLVATIFAVLYFLEPTCFYNIVIGNDTFRAIHDVAAVKSCPSLSNIAVFFGPLTMWFPFIMIGAMFYNIKRITSSLHVCAVVLLCFATKFAIQETELATIFAPVFAISFAYITIWLFSRTSFQSYFTSLKTERIGLRIRRVFKPVPFLSIFIILVAICAPNALYAIDASIPNNSNEYSGIDLGAIGCNIKADDEWKKNSVLLEYNDIQKSGAMVTWIDSANEAAAFGNFNVTIDSKGNGAISTSNIFLSKSPAAAMLLRSMQCNGFDTSKNTLLNAGMTADQFIEIKNCFDSPDKKDIKDSGICYAIKTNISDESVSYLAAESILTDSFSEQEISQMYRKLCDTHGQNIEYIMVTSDMFPMYLDRHSSFTALANASGYVVNDQGTIPQFLDVNSASYSAGIYNYTDAMYNTALWKAYIGMPPSKAEKVTPHEYLNSLMLSNGTYKATPGYGLFNYTVDSEHWYVMYNGNSNATLSSSGWIKMSAIDAQKKQIVEGGLINYLSGFPVILKYTNNPTFDHIISGRVGMSNVPVKGIYVAATDENKTLHSYDYTNTDGKYEITARDGQKIIFAASSSLDTGNIIFTKTYNSSSDNPNITIPVTSLSGRIIGSGDNPLKILSPLKVTLTGRNTNNSLSTTLDCNAQFSFEPIIPDTYDITITNESGSHIYSTQSYTVIAGVNNKDVNLKIETCRVTINTINDASVVVSGDTVVMTEKYGAKFKGTSSNGVAIIDVVPGTYSYSANEKVLTLPVSTISSDISITARLHNSKEVTISGLGNGSAIIYSKGYTKPCTDTRICVPVGSGNTATYTFYAITESGVCLSKVDSNTDRLDLTSLSAPAVEVSGTLTNSSNMKVSGTIIFIKDEMEIPVSSDSKGFYKVLLPKGTYSVYASHDSEVRIIKEFVSVDTKDIKDKNIKLSSGTKILGYTCWSKKSQSTALSYIPVKVSSISGIEGVSFTVLSGSDGSYSFNIPSHSTCTLTGLINADNSNYYYNEPVGMTKSEKLEVIEGENFIANVKEAGITNSTDYGIKIDEMPVNAKERAKIVSKEPVWKTKLCYKETPYVVSESIIPISTTEVIPSLFTNCTCSKLTLLNTINEDIVTIRTLDSSTIWYKTIVEKAQYLVENNRQFIITVTGPEVKSVYKITELSGDTTFNVRDFSDYDLFHVNGYVGISKPGTLKVLSYNEKEQSESQYNIDSNGRYSIDLPTSHKHKLYAHVPVRDENGLIHYLYSGQRELDEHFEFKETYTRNLVVTSQEYKSNDVTVSDIYIEKMTADAKSKINFSFMIINNTGENASFLMHAGSGWTDLTFYKSDKFGRCTDEQIDTVTIDKSIKVHAVGIADKNTAGLGTDDLSVIVTDIKNKVVCIGILNCDSNWIKTASNTSLVSHGSNSIADQEYSYSIQIKNCDNFDKRYKISPSGIDNGTWFQTLVSGNKICDIKDDIIIPGYEEATIYVKITTINGKTGVPGIPNINIKVIRPNETFLTNNDTGEAEAIDNSCVIKSEKNKRIIEISKLSASGDVYLESYIRPYIWMIIGIAFLAITSLAWPSIKEILIRKKLM